MRPPRPAPRPKRGRPPKRGVLRSLAWRFLLACGPDFRGTRRRMDSILADFRAFAFSHGWEVSTRTPDEMRNLLRSARRAFPESRAKYDAAKRAATAQRAEARAAREAARKR